MLEQIARIDVGRCRKSLLAGRGLIAALTAIGGICGVFTSEFAIESSDVFQAAATVCSFSENSYEKAQQGLSAIRTYSEMIKSHYIAGRAAELLSDSGISEEMIYDMIWVKPLVVEGTTYVYEDNSSVISIYAEYQDAEQAEKVVNAVADAFAWEINRLLDDEAVRVLDYAQSSEQLYDGQRTQILTGIGGFALGFVLGCAIMIARAVFSKKIYSAVDVELYCKMDVVGEIPELDHAFYRDASC